MLHGVLVLLNRWRSRSLPFTKRYLSKTGTCCLWETQCYQGKSLMKSKGYLQTGIQKTERLNARALQRDSSRAKVICWPNVKVTHNSHRHEPHHGVKTTQHQRIQQGGIKSCAVRGSIPFWLEMLSDMLSDLFLFARRVTTLQAPSARSDYTLRYEGSQQHCLSQWSVHMSWQLQQRTNVRKHFWQCPWKSVLLLLLTSCWPLFFVSAKRNVG